MTAPPVVAAALEYAARGWPVFPLQAAIQGVKESGKRPLTPHGVKDATTDAGQIRAWWATWPEANVGIACGPELVVVDIDTATPPSPFDEFPASLTVTTGRGMHVYLDAKGETFPNRANVRPGVDVRSAGGYVVAPPSVHYTGRVYQWGESAEIAAVPERWLAYMRRSKLERAPAPRLDFDGDAGDVMQRARAYLRAIPGAVSGQGGHKQTFSAAMAMVRGFALPLADALALLEDYNRRCTPEWTPTELEHKAKSALAEGTMPMGSLLVSERPRAREYRVSLTRPPEPPLDAYDDAPPDATGPPPGKTKKKKKPAGPPPVLDGTHEGLARHIIAHLARVHGPLVYDEGDFYGYRDGVWSPIPRKPDMWGAVQALNGEPYGPDGKTLNVTKGLVDSVLSLAEATLTREAFFAEAPAGLALSDGFLTATGDALELVPHDPEHRCRHRYDVRYRDASESKCPRFLQALDEWGLTAPQQVLIGEWIGLMLLGLSTTVGFGLVLVLVGEGADGKSVLIDTLEGIVPREWQAHVGMQELTHRFTGIDLVGARLNTVGDGSPGEFRDSSKFKLVTTGGTMRVEQKNQAAFSARMWAAHAFSFNTLPRFTDDSHGMLRRFAGGVIPFTRRVPKAKRDPRLTEKLVAEAHGIIGWALGHAAERIARGAWTEIESDAFDDWRRESNPVEQWRDERTTATGWTDAAASYRDFRKWCEENGYAVPSSKVFGGRLRRLLGHGGTKRSNGTWYAIELKHGGVW